MYLELIGCCLDLVRMSKATMNSVTCVEGLERVNRKAKGVGEYS